MKNGMKMMAFHNDYIPVQTSVAGVVAQGESVNSAGKNHLMFKIVYQYEMVTYYIDNGFQETTYNFNINVLNTLST